MLDRLPADLIESILLLSLETADTEDTRGLAQYSALCRSMREPSRRAALFGVLPDARVLGLLKAEPALARHIRTYVFTTPGDEDTREGWRAQAAQVLHLARLAERLVVDTLFEDLDPFFIAALGGIAWRDVSLRWAITEEEEEADDPVSAETQAVRVATFLSLVETAAMQAVRLEIRLDDIPLRGGGAVDASWPSLPNLRTLIAIDACAFTLPLVARLAPALTTLAFDRVHGWGAAPLGDFGFAEFAKTIERIEVLDGGYLHRDMLDMPALRHLSITANELAINACQWLGRGQDQSLESLTLRSHGESRMLTSMSLLYMAIIVRPSTAAPPWRRLRLIGVFDDTIEAVLRELRSLCDTRQIVLEVLLYEL